MKRTAAEALQGEIAAAKKALDRATSQHKSASDAVQTALVRQSEARQDVIFATERVRRAEAALAALIPLQEELTAEANEARAKEASDAKAT